MRTPSTKNKISRELKKYDSEALKSALEEIKKGKSVYSTSKKYQIPKTTLLRRVWGKYDMDTKKGKKAVLTLEQEQYLEDWVFHAYKIGFSVTKVQLLDSVQHMVKELKISNNFNDGRPGRIWYEGFIKRHPTIHERVSQNLTKTAATVNEEKIRNWFAEVLSFLQEKQLENILNDANRVFNCDEAALFLSPKENAVLAKKGTKAVYSAVANDQNEFVTSLITANAAGTLAPCMVLYQYKRLPAVIRKSMPKGWAVGLSKGGWLTGETFYEYIANVFHPWLVKSKIELPVILYLDAKASHLTLHLTKFCKENKIILIALIANSKHIFEPLNVSVSDALKLKWRNAVRDWRMEHDGDKLKKEHFAAVLKKVLSDETHKTNLVSAFRTCGLCPFDPNAINYNKYFGSAQSVATENRENTETVWLNGFDFIEQLI